MEPKDRLIKAREAAGYKSPSEAARLVREINKNTITSNENGHRPISRKMAEVYAKAFNVSAGWLLYGENEATAAANEAEAPQLTEPKDEELFREAYRRAREIEMQLLGGRGPRLEFAKMVSIIYEEMLSEKSP